MKPTLKKTFLTLTMLSTGLLAFAPLSAQAAGYKKPKTTPVASNTSFKQYPLLGEVKDEVNAAMSLHQTATSLLSEKEQLEAYKKEIEKYNEIERRLAQNEQCNISQLNEHFANGSGVWKKVSAWAEDSATVLLAKAADSLGDDSETSKQLKQLESGDAESAAGVTTSAADSPYASVNENTTTEQMQAMVASGTNEADQASSTDMNIDEAMAYGKVRWDVGYAVLKDIYASPKKWGSLKKEFSPWVDQKRIYDVYLSNFYEELESYFVETSLRPFPPKPQMAKNASYLPEDMYNGEIPVGQVTSDEYNDKTASVDDKWCGQTDGKKNKCVRVNTGALFAKHQAFVQALKSYPLKGRVQQGSLGAKVDLPDFRAPYVPQRPLPPWRESVYIMSVEKQIPELASDLPDPWFKVTQSIDNFAPKGELSNLVEKHGKTVRYRPSDYNAETGEIKNNKDGTPRLPLPLMMNRVSSYLSLIAARDEQKPIMERAKASIQEMNENIISALEQVGYSLPNASSFDLAKESDYNMVIAKITELQNNRIGTAKAKMNTLRASFGGRLLPSVTQMLAEETTTMDALQKDSEFMIGVTRNNAADINSLLMTAVADATANQTYKDNLNGKLEELSTVPTVGCPVL